MTMRFWQLLISILILANLASALSLLWIRQQNQQLFIELQDLQQQRDVLNQSWSQLQLEHSTWSQQQRIERLARQRLNMMSPTPEQTVIIHE